MVKAFLVDAAGWSISSLLMYVVAYLLLRLIGATNKLSLLNNAACYTATLFLVTFVDASQQINTGGGRLSGAYPEMFTLPFITSSIIIIIYRVYLWNRSMR